MKAELAYDTDSSIESEPDQPPPMIYELLPVVSNWTRVQPSLESPTKSGLVDGVYQPAVASTNWFQG